MGQAAQVMAHFLTQPEPAVGDTIRVPPVTPLVHIGIPVMFAIEECVDALHDLLALIPICPDAAYECLDAFTDYEKPRQSLASILEDGRAKIDNPQDADRVMAMLGKTKSI